MNTPTEPFVAYGKTPRLFRDVILTEKIDGTNALVFIDDSGGIFAGSRARWITPEADNYGFARWVDGNKAELLKLGPGRHFGEWWGAGIQRGYGLKEKRFSLFNVGRWATSDATQPGIFEFDEGATTQGPSCCYVVPALWRGVLDTSHVKDVAACLRIGGSVAAPGFMNPEGVIVYHEAAQRTFKVLLENDDMPKGRA